MAHEDIVGAIGRFVDAVNGGDVAGALACLAADVTIVEDVAPYRWQGPAAGAEWMLAMARNAEAAGMTEVAMRIGAPVRVEVEGGHGYAVVPGVLRLRGGGASLRSDGSLTFALRRGDEAWLISAMAWTGAAPQPEP
jgi:ketosteroid isomerase-like protein